MKLRRSTGPRTLAIDIGGTGVKALVLDSKGKPLTDRVREETPKPATPHAIVTVLKKLVAQLGDFDRVSCVSVRRVAFLT